MIKTETQPTIDCRLCKHAEVGEYGAIFCHHPDNQTGVIMCHRTAEWCSYYDIG